MKFFSLFVLLLVSLQFTKQDAISILKKKIIVVENPINLNRQNETITLSVALLQSLFPNQKMNFIQIE